MSEALEWWGGLTPNQKIGLKEMSASVCGLPWDAFSMLFSPRERIEMIYHKIQEII
jgi:hypothetical protein